MIILSVDSYCHDCSKFSPEVIDETFYGEGVPYHKYSAVVCKHRFECEQLVKYLKQELMRSTEK